jgi:hypothetical protein
MAFLVLFVLFSFASFIYDEGNADRFDIRKSSDLPLNETEIAEMAEKNTPAIDPAEFEWRKSDKNTLAVYGELPSKEGTVSYDWHLLLMTISDSVQSDPALEEYTYAYGGSIFGYGATYAGGYMIVEIAFDRAEQLTEEDLEIIKNVFEKHVNKYGVKDLPIVIACENMAVMS